MTIFTRIINRVRSRLYEYALPVLDRNITIGKGLTTRKGLSLNASEGGKITIGRSCFFNRNCSINAHLAVTIGDHCLFGENVCVYDHNHVFRDPNTPISAQGYRSEAVTIGNHCWIASNVTILRGVTIGDHCVIGAGCLVYQDVPENTVMKLDQSVVYSKREGS